jgi:hypothetical protein
MVDAQQRPKAAEVEGDGSADQTLVARRERTKTEKVIR